MELPIDLRMFLILFLGLFLAMNIVAWIKGFINIKKSLSIVRNNAKLLKTYSKKTISIIIPVRNDRSIDDLLKILLKLPSNIVKEIIVIDDNSDNWVKDVILKYSKRDKRLKYIRLEGLPKGWSPKSYACYIGYLNSYNPIICFLDADTILFNPKLYTSLAAGIREDIVLSFMPEFLCKTKRCRIAETVLTTFSHAFLGFDKVSNPSNKLAWYYGCCWCISRSLYEKIGTHYIVRNSIVEDRDLAEHVKKEKHRIVVVYIPGLVGTLWYDDLSSSIKVLARVLRRHGLKKEKAFSSAALVFLGYYLPIISSIIGVLTYSIPIIVLSIINYIILTIAHYFGAKINKYNYIYALIAPLLGILLVKGIIEAYKRKYIEWRGRIYDKKYF